MNDSTPVRTPAIMPSQPLYEVIVGNVGRVHSGHKARLARTVYNAYVKASVTKTSRAYGEHISLWKDGEIVAERMGTANVDANVDPDVRISKFTVTKCDGNPTQLAVQLNGRLVANFGVGPNGSYVHLWAVKGEPVEISLDCC